MGTVRDHGITKLYSYQPKLEYLESTLQGITSHCTSPENFNDPWDSKPGQESRASMV